MNLQRLVGRGLPAHVYRIPSYLRWSQIDHAAVMPTTVSIPTIHESSLIDTEAARLKLFRFCLATLKDCMLLASCDFFDTAAFKNEENR